MQPDIRVICLCRPGSQIGLLRTKPFDVEQMRAKL